MAALSVKQARSSIRSGGLGLAGAICLSVLGVGCSTTLTVDHLATSDTAPLRGVNYFLPFTQFELTVSRTLTACPPVGDDLEYKTRVIVVSYTSQPDPTQEYQIDLTTLSNFWKTSDLKMSLFPGGMLQSFNATASDQTAQIYQNVLSGVGEIAATVATGGLAPAQPAQQAPPLPPGQLPQAAAAPSVCNAKTLRALEMLKAGTVDNALDVATAKLNRDSSDLKALLTATASMGKQLDSEVQNHILKAVELVNGDLAVEAGAQKRVSDYQKVLTLSTTFRWPVSGALDAKEEGVGQNTAPDAQQVILPGALNAVKSWTTASTTSSAIPFVVSIRLQRLHGEEQVPTETDESGSSGIRFRVPARAQLVLCDSTPPPAQDNGAVAQQNGPPPKPPRGRNQQALPKCGSSDSLTTLPASADAIWEGNVPQLGRVNFLPYINRIFQNNVLSASFNVDGTLASAEYSEPSSAGVTASSAFSATASNAATTVGTIANAPVTRLNARLAQLQALNNITAAEATASTAAQSNQLTQIQTQNNLIAAQAAQAVASQVAQATANTSLLNALAAQDNAQTALKTAQASLTP